MIEQVRLGGSGLHVSRLALGTMSIGDPSLRAWMLDEQAAEPIVRRALELGITFFDTADMYSDGASEVVTGRLLRRLIAREEIVVATKVFYPTTPGPNGRGLSRKHILAAIDASLERLGLDYVDLYQIHRWDPQTPIEETIEALHDVVRAGKVRYLGASTMAAWQFAKTQHVAELHGWTRFVSMQCRYNLLDREVEREMIPLCLDQGVAVLPYSPLARGLLAGSRSEDGEPRTVRARTDALQKTFSTLPGAGESVGRVAEIARRRDLPAAPVALAWVLQKRGVTAPILGATRPSHLDDAAAATEVELDDEEVRFLEEASVPGAAEPATSGEARL
jgi:aryl-alcohol dehydrogenase-like predicted oxidoreductase